MPASPLLPCKRFISTIFYRFHIERVNIWHSFFSKRCWYYLGIILINSLKQRWHLASFQKQVSGGNWRLSDGFVIIWWWSWYSRKRFGFVFLTRLFDFQTWNELNIQHADVHHHISLSHAYSFVFFVLLYSSLLLARMFEINHKTCRLC